MHDTLRNWLFVWVAWYTLKHAYPGTEIFVVIGAVIYLLARVANWIGARRQRKAAVRQAAPPRRRASDASSIGRA